MGIPFNIQMKKFSTSLPKPRQTRVGMDLVIHEHIKELAADSEHRSHRGGCCPGIDGQPAEGVPSR